MLTKLVHKHIHCSKRSRSILKPLCMRTTFSEDRDDDAHNDYRLIYFRKRITEFEALIELTPKPVSEDEFKQALYSKWGQYVLATIITLEGKLYLQISKLYESNDSNYNYNSLCFRLTETNLINYVLKYIKEHPDEKGPEDEKCIYIPLYILLNKQV